MKEELIYEICIGFILFWSSLSSSKNMISLFLPQPDLPDLNVEYAEDKENLTLGDGTDPQNAKKQAPINKMLGLIRLVLAKFIFVSCIAVLWRFRESTNFGVVCISYVSVFIVFIVFSIFRFTKSKGLL